MSRAQWHRPACGLPLRHLAALTTTLCALSSAADAADASRFDALRARVEALAAPLQARQETTRRALAACQAATPTRDCTGLATEVPALAALANERAALSMRLADASTRCRGAAAKEPSDDCDPAWHEPEVAWLEAAAKDGAAPVLAGAAEASAAKAAAKASAEQAEAAVSAATADLLKRLKSATTGPQTPGNLAAEREIARARSSAKTAGDAAKAVSLQADELVARGLALARCPRGDDGVNRCGPGEDWDSLVALGQQSLRELGRQQLALRRAVNETRVASWTAQASKQIGLLRQERARRFLELLEDSTDAATLAGQDAATVTATTAGSTAALRYSFDRRGSASLNRFNVTFSTPLDTEKARTTLWRRSADGLAGRPKVELSYTRLELFEAGFLAPGLSLSSARQTVEYVDRTDLSKLKTDRSSPLSIGAHVIGSRNAEGAQLFSLRLERQFRAKPSDDTVTVCPPTPVTGSVVLDCLTGGDGAPVRQYETVARLEYQRAAWFSGADLGFALTHNARTDKTEVEVPIYLVRSGAEGDKGKRNAGISLSWASKGGGWAIGVFVGTPFSLNTLNGAP